MVGSDPKVIAGYRVVRRIASGGMATVYEARSPTDRRVALKVMHAELADDPGFVAMLGEEARLGSCLAHPNIASVLASGSDGVQRFIAVEYVDGVSLADLLRDKPEGLTPDLALAVVMQLLRALHHAHARRGPDEKLLGIIHRDVSPQNVMIDRRGTVKLVDFGIAFASGRAIRTETGVLKGKLLYLAPEQLDGSAIDAKVDQYSAALVLFECLTKTRAMEATNEVELLRRVSAANVPFERFKALRMPALEDDVRTALAKSPAERHSSCAVFSERLFRHIAEKDSANIAASLGKLVNNVIQQSAPTGLHIEEQTTGSRGRKDPDATIVEHARITIDMLVGLLEKTLGAEKAREVVIGCALLHGLEPGKMTERQAQMLLETSAQLPGLVGVASKFAIKKLPDCAKACSADCRWSSTCAPSPPKPVVTPPRRSTLAGQLKTQRLPRSELVKLLSHSIGEEKSDEVVLHAASKLSLDSAAFNRAEAMRILDDLGKSSGVIGVTARFAKTRCVLRFPE